MDIEILQIAADTKNNKNIKNYTHKSKYKSKLCGDEIEISLVIKNQNEFLNINTKEDLELAERINNKK